MTEEIRRKLLAMCDAFDRLGEALDAGEKAAIKHSAVELRKTVAAIREMLATS